MPKPTASAPFPAKTLTLGSSGPAVDAVRCRLIAIGYVAAAAPAGTPFDRTLAAQVELFQARSIDSLGCPLKVDGIVGPMTWAGLFAQPLPTVTTPCSALAGAALAVAASQVGTREQPLGSNRGPQVDAYLRSVHVDPTTGSYPWCAAFVYWCFAQAAEAEKVFNPLVCTARVEDHWHRSTAARVIAIQATAQPELVQPGMIFFLGTRGGNGHTGLVEKTSGSYLTTIEGNTNAGGSREGIGVFRRDSRTIDSINLGFLAY